MTTYGTLETMSPTPPQPDPAQLAGEAEARKTYRTNPPSRAGGAQRRTCFVCGRRRLTITVYGASLCRDCMHIEL